MIKNAKKTYEYKYIKANYGEVCIYYNDYCITILSGEQGEQFINHLNATDKNEHQRLMAQVAGGYLK